ncbi:glycosyltransferase family 2 protein [Leptospira perdikensis]|uniref:Glycosyltransferase n=1 Tax=Leptospira perdikensis TaxID=2484948 RepID=A0A4R9JEX9_9LEPT|nr:glycosyltransferase family 2 protein [Leptospira perdikensis]TGL37127.1 glycosyltransferase [Leptospira perdikensis]
MKSKSKTPKISIITIVLNNRIFLDHTIQSVASQEFTNYEYIIIDGGSTDGTKELIKDSEKKIDYWVSEPDRGIYDAMNKGAKLAKGEWLLFLNAGDRFANPKVLSDIFQLNNLNTYDFIFGNWYTCNLLKTPDLLIPGTASYERGAILHQSVVYKKKLHEVYGYYLLTPKLIISDYIFFLSIPRNLVFHFEHPISINDNTGVSTAPWSYKQKLAIDYVFRRITAFRLVVLYLKFHIPRFDLYLSKKLSELFTKH